MSVALVTKRLQALGHPVELVRGKGYHYFVYDDGTHYVTESVMVMHFRSIPYQQWVDDGETFARATKTKITEQELIPSGQVILSAGVRSE